MRAALVLLAGAAISFTSVPSQAVEQPGVPRQTQPAPSVSQPSDRVIIRWEAGTTRAERKETRDAVGTTDSTGLGQRFQLLEFADGQDPDATVAALKADPAVADAERDGYSELQATTPDDPRFNELWGLDNQGLNVGGVSTSTPGADIDALKAWEKTVGDASVVVADLDDGIRPDHPDLKNRIWNNADEVAGDGIDNDANGYVDDTFGMDFAGANLDLNPLVFDNDPTDSVMLGGHGTHTAGTIAAEGNNGQGITGVAQQATIMPLRVCGYRANGASACPFSSQIAGINYAGTNGAKIANMSLGGTGKSDLVRDALAANPQTLFVIAAGNDNVDNDLAPRYPCSFDPTTSSITGAVDNVVCVAASDQNDGKASFSNWGKTRVDLAAPGTQTMSTYTYSERFSDDFEKPGFPAGWSTDGWIRVATSPQGSAALTNDTASQGEGISRFVTSPALNLTGDNRCLVQSTESLQRSGADSLRWEVLVDGVAVINEVLSATYAGSFSDAITTTGAGPHTLSVRYTYTKQAGGASTNGFWLDRWAVNCWTPPGSEGSGDYAFLQGTSMATPHVTGAAALLAAYEPSATTMQLKQALLSSVDPNAAFDVNGLRPVSTGGRLNADKALSAVDALITPETSISSAPSGGTADTTATFAFTSDAKTPVTFECQVDGADFTACSSPFTVNALAVGDHVFEVRAKDAPGNVDSTPATASWTVAAPSPPQEPPAKPALAAPAKVTGVKVKRKKTTAIIRWSAVPGATSYTLTVGKTSKTISKPSFTLKLKAKSKAKVKIAAVNSSGSSPLVTVKVKRAK